MKRICVFCGANAGRSPAYESEARALGECLVKNGIGLVYGGGSTGLMGAVAAGAMSSGGEVIGVMPKSLVDRELSDDSITTLEVVDDMHERKARMATLADAFIAMPGGIGTLEELFEALTWSQLGFQNKRCGVLNVEGYYDSLIAFLNHADDEGFIRNGLGHLLTVESNPINLVEQLTSTMETT